MPVYEYRNKATGEVVELVRPVAQRDCVPGNLVRVTVPRRINYVQGVLDSTDADVSTPKGFRQLEETIPGGYRAIEKQTGFSAEHIKRVWNI